MNPPLQSSNVLRRAGIALGARLGPLLAAVASDTKAHGGELSLPPGEQLLPLLLLLAVLGAAIGFLLLTVQILRAKEPTVQLTAPPRDPVSRVCTYCKATLQRGSDGQDRWVSPERTLGETEGGELSHGVCPRCYALRLKPQLEAAERKRRQG